MESLAHNFTNNVEMPLAETKGTLFTRDNVSRSFSTVAGRCPTISNPTIGTGGAIMADRSVGSLLAVALSACSGTFDGSDKIDVALLRSRNEDNAAENG